MNEKRTKSSNLMNNYKKLQNSYDSPIWILKSSEKINSDENESHQKTTQYNDTNFFNTLNDMFRLNLKYTITDTKETDRFQPQH